MSSDARVRRDDPTTGALLSVDDLRKSFPVRRSPIDAIRFRPRAQAVAVDGVSLRARRGERLGVVGESGSGKTTLARCILQLVPPDSGSILFDGRQVVGARRKELQQIRRRMQMIFQDPFSSLNPRLRVGSAIAEPARVHDLIKPADEQAHVERLLDLVGLPATTAASYPRQLSGGQRQRVAIARALSLSPDLLIADEPVSALDVSIQAQVLNLLEDLTSTLGLTVVFIAHQLSVVQHICDRVAVMYLGRIVEIGSIDQVFNSPQHPYTRALLAAAPRPDPTYRHEKPAIQGDIPSPLRIPSGCRFRTRCAFAEQRCEFEDPALEPLGPEHEVACLVRPFTSSISGPVRVAAHSEQIPADRDSSDAG
jgi:oligopeptide/dipeptide ABC transporter ATP-binding protein